MTSSPGERERAPCRGRHTRVLAFTACALTISACILQRGQKVPSAGRSNDYVGAAVFAGTGVAAAVVNRKLTGDCYAVCPRGYACDHDSGICERLECDCPADEVCDRVAGEIVCVQPPHRDQAEWADGGPD